MKGSTYAHCNVSYEEITVRCLEVIEYLDWIHVSVTTEICMMNNSPLSVYLHAGKIFEEIN